MNKKYTILAALLLVITAAVNAHNDDSLRNTPVNNESGNVSPIAIVNPDGSLSPVSVVFQPIITGTLMVPSTVASSIVQTAGHSPLYVSPEISPVVSPDVVVVQPSMRRSPAFARLMNTTPPIDQIPQNLSRGLDVPLSPNSTVSDASTLEMLSIADEFGDFDLNG